MPKKKKNYIKIIKKKISKETVMHAKNTFRLGDTARHLLTIFTENENERCRFYAARMRSLVESNKNIHQVLEDDIDVPSGVNSPWSKLTMLVIISGEIIVAA